MSIVKGFQKIKRYRKTDAGYKLQSQWTSSETVEMEDGNSLEHNLGNIKGITDSFDDDSNIALSSKAGRILADQIATLNGSLSALGNIRYNIETDMVQLFNGTEWVDWKIAGLIWDGILYNSGNQYLNITGGYETYIPEKDVPVDGNCPLITYNPNYIKIHLSAITYYNARYGVITNLNVPIPNTATTLNIKYNILIDKVGAGDTSGGRVYLMYGNEEVSEIFFKNNNITNKLLNIGITSDMRNNPKQIIAYLYAVNGNEVRLQITKIWFE